MSHLIKKTFLSCSFIFLASIGHTAAVHAAETPSIPRTLPAVFSVVGHFQEEEIGVKSIELRVNQTAGTAQLIYTTSNGDVTGRVSVQDETARFYSDKSCASLPLRNNAFGGADRKLSVQWQDELDLRPSGIFFANDDGSIYVAANLLTTPVFFQVDEYRAGPLPAEPKPAPALCDSPQSIALTGSMTGNENWKGGTGKAKHSGKPLKMSSAEMVAAQAKCLLDSQCFLKPGKAQWGWHCGAGVSSKKNIYLSPIDYTCQLHDDGKYDACGLHHSLYCAQIDFGVFDTTPQHAVLVTDAIVRQQFIKRQLSKGKCPAMKEKKNLPKCIV
jgi:hypothetical protein